MSQSIDYLKNSLYLGLVSVVISDPAYAAVIQCFHANNYTNPASLQQTNIGEFMAGAFVINPHFTFRGVGNTGASGEANSDVTDVMSIYSAAYRLNKKFVIGGDISIPYTALISYPEDSIVASDVSKTTVKDVDFSPKVSMKVNDQFSVGAGININNLYDFQANFVNILGPINGNIVNRAKAWSFGWNVGALYAVNECNILGLSYYSRLKPNLKGTSSGVGQYTANFMVKGLVLPAVVKGTYTHIFSKQWLGEIGASWSQWSSTQTINFYNIAGAGNVPFNVNYKSTWSFYALGRYQFNPTWAALGIVIYDQPAAHQYARLIQFPDFKLYLFKAGASYQINKEAAFQVIAGYAFSRSAIYQPLSPISSSMGKLNLDAYTLDIRFIYKL